MQFCVYILSFKINHLWYRDISFLADDSYISTNINDQKLLEYDNSNIDPLFLPGDDLNSRNHSIVNRQLNFSVEGKEIGKEFSSILPSIRNQSFENENPYKFKKI